MSDDFDRHVAKALQSVKGGQHLRFTNSHFLTSQVCLAAVKYESTHNTMMPSDIHAVPAGNIEFVISEMRKILNKNDMEPLEKALQDRLELAKKPDYFGDFYGSYTSLEMMLDHWGVTSYDDFLRKRFNRLQSDAKKSKEEVMATKHAVK